MTEVSVQGRDFLQPPEGLGLLGRVAADLPRVPLNPLKRRTTHVSWVCAAVLELIQRAEEEPERHRRPWSDITTSDRSIFLAFQLETDAFVTRSLPNAPSPSRPVRGGASGLPRRSGKGSAIGTWMVRPSLLRERARTPFDPLPFAMAAMAPWRVLSFSRFRPFTRRRVKIHWISRRVVVFCRHVPMSGPSLAYHRPWRCRGIVRDKSEASSVS